MNDDFNEKKSQSEKSSLKGKIKGWHFLTLKVYQNMIAAKLTSLSW